MTQEILPKDFPEISERIYAGFWRRFGAVWLDILFTAPIGFAFLYLNSLGRLNAFYTLIPSHIFFIIYFIWFVEVWGATPGKLLLKVKIIKKTGHRVGWKEATLRQIILWNISSLHAVSLLLPLLRMSDIEFLDMTWVDRWRMQKELAPYWSQAVYWLFQVWLWSTVIVLLSNSRRRALHDYVAGTVVIKKKYEHVIEQYLRRGGLPEQGHESHSGGMGMQKRPVSYSQSLKLAWFLTWRACVFLLVFLLAGSSLLGTMIHEPVESLPAWASFVIGIAWVLVWLFLVIPWFIRSMFKKRFSSFRVETIPLGRESVVSGDGPSGPKGTSSEYP